jgi:ubiquinone biosynthesis protein
MGLVRGVAGVRSIRRFGAIARVLIRHGYEDIAERLFRKGDLPPPGDRRAGSLRMGVLPSPERFRVILEELGPSFIKLGQLMSVRADMFPPAYITELRKLQDRVPPIPFDAVREAVEGEVGRPLAEIFAAFDTDCLAAASVAQVHRATLFTGEKVAVKIVRPDIARKIREDIRLMYGLAQRIESFFEVGRILAPVNLVREFERTIFKELDMFIEAGNLEKFARHFEDSDEIHIPRVHWDYTTRSVLVMEYIAGIKMDQVAAIRDHGIDPKRIALIGLRSFSRQLMEFGYFHADPHPGNTIVKYNGQVGLVDFGITGYLDETTMLNIANLFLGFAEHDYDMVMDVLWDLGLIDEETVDVAGFRSDLIDISEPFYGRSLQTISVKDVYDQVMQLILKHRIRMPRNLLLLLKTFIQTEALGKILGSDASLLEVTRPYAKKLIQRGYEAQKVFNKLGRDARTMRRYMESAPRYLHDILRQTARGKSRMELRHTGFDGLDRQIEKGVNRLTVGIVLAASILAGAMVLNASQTILDFTIDFFGAQEISLTAVLGVTGYVIATILGIWLILSIFRSGKL